MGNSATDTDSDDVFCVLLHILCFASHFQAMFLRCWLHG